MRMNRGTIVLLLVSLVVIVAVLVLTINQATAPGTDDAGDTPAESTPEALFAVASAESIVRLEFRDDMTGDRLVLSRSADGGEWAIDAAEPLEGDVDQTQSDGLLTSLLALQSQESFEADDLAQYGLAQPAYSIYAVAEDGAIQVLHVGNQNPAGTRYYTVQEQLAPGTSRPDLDLMQPLLERAEVETSLDADDTPVTEEADATNAADTADDTEAEATREFSPTLEALAQAIEDAETEAEATELAATYSAIVQATNAADSPGDETTEADASATAEADATEAADGVDAENELEPLGERADVDTSITTLEADAVEAIDATPGAAVTAEATAEMTAEPVREPLVNLEGPKTVYLVNVATIRSLIGAIAQPPIAIPLEAPTATPVEIVPDDLTPEMSAEEAAEDLTNADATEAADMDAEATAES